MYLSFSVKRSVLIFNESIYALCRHTLLQRNHFVYALATQCNMCHKIKMFRKSRLALFN